MFNIWVIARRTGIWVYKPGSFTTSDEKFAQSEKTLLVFYPHHKIVYASGSDQHLHLEYSTGDLIRLDLKPLVSKWAKLGVVLTHVGVVGGIATSHSQVERNANIALGGDVKAQHQAHVEAQRTFGEGLSAFCNYIGAVGPTGIALFGWYPDPIARYHYRYWDGAEWTSQVSLSGVSSVDLETDPLDYWGGMTLPLAASRAGGPS